VSCSVELAGDCRMRLEFAGMNASKKAPLEAGLRD
jgi:hypothetical protein